MLLLRDNLPYFAGSAHRCVDFKSEIGIQRKLVESITEKKQRLGNTSCRVGESWMNKLAVL